MTTLAANKPRAYEGGERNTFPVIASDIIYEGAAVGIVKASGHARPLVAGDRFVGFAERTADNSAGAAAAINVTVIDSGKIVLPITGLVISDQGASGNRLPVYATDDDAFSLSPVGGSFVGFLHRYVSAGVGVVQFDVSNHVDPYLGWTHELKSANYTVDAEDNGKFLWVDTDAVVITLPSIEGIARIRVGNIAAFGVSGVAISPGATDMVEGPDVTAADNKDIINTKATAARGDYVEINYGDANGYAVVQKIGVWAREA